MDQSLIKMKLKIQSQSRIQQEYQSFTMENNQDVNKQSLLSQQGFDAATDATINDITDQFELTPLQQLLDKVGGEGKYQFRTFMIFNLMWFLTSWMLVGQGFFFDNRYECVKSFQTQQQCQSYICGLPQASRKDELSWHARSIVFAFETQYLICENDYLVPILTSLLYAGSLLGFFVIPYVADNWGRRIAIRISWGLFFFGILAICLADSPNMIGMGQLLSGFGCNPAITLCYSFLNQQVLRAKRQYYGVTIQVFLAIGQCTIAFMFIPDYDWRVVPLILLGLVFVNWMLLNYLVQSPKFLISKSKKETLEVLNIIAKRNGREPLQQKQIKQIQVADNSNSQGTSLYDLFKYKSLRMATIGGGVVFLAIQVIYYGTLLNLDNIGYSKLVNQEIIGVSQACGYILAQIFISKIFRKKWSIVGMGLSSILCFVLAFFTIFQNQNNQQAMKIIQTVGLIFNRLILCAFWALFYVYIAELYPTKVRSMGFGWASAMGTVGSTLAPYLTFYSQQALHLNSWIPLGVIGLCGFGSIFCLKQTFKKPMYDEIEEVRLKGKWELSDDQDNNEEEND